MTKAERIFRDTKHECRKHVENWGYNPDTDGGFTGLIYRDNETVSVRTLNAVSAILDRETRNLAECVKLQIGTPEKNDFREKVLLMAKRTLQNEAKKHKAFVSSLKEIKKGRKR